MNRVHLVTKDFLVQTDRKTGRDMWVLAVDPGDTTGFAEAFFEHLSGGLFEVEICTRHARFDSKKLLGDLRTCVTCSEHIVWETFLLYPHKAKQQTGSQFPAVQVIGWISGHAIMLNKPTHHYPASVCKQITDDQLRAWFGPDSLPEVVHERDALRVLATFILKEFNNEENFEG